MPKKSAPTNYNGYFKNPINWAVVSILLSSVPSYFTDATDQFYTLGLICAVFGLVKSMQEKSQKGFVFNILALVIAIHYLFKIF